MGSEVMRRRYRRNPTSGTATRAIWAAIGVAAAWKAWQWHEANGRREDDQPEYTTPGVIPAEKVPTTPPVDMVARYVQASAPGYVGVPYGPPVWNGRFWEQPT
jgi:hypothetical protein